MNPKIEKLVKQFAKLPRVGTRAAQRIVLSLLQDKTGRAPALAAALIDAVENIAPCATCGVLSQRDQPCEFCRDITRATGQLCIVRDMADVWTLEKSAVFHGRYHILGGLLSGAGGVTPDDLNITTLAARIADENITEIIFALPNTIEEKQPSTMLCRLLVVETCPRFQNWRPVCRWAAIWIIWMTAH